MCPDESNKPNEIECVETNRLIVHFKLTDQNSLSIECSWPDQSLTDNLLGLQQINSIKQIQNNSNRIIKHSFLIPHSFDLNELKLPNDIFNCSSSVKTYSIYYLLSFIAFVVLIIFCWRKMTVNKFTILNSHRKIVTFYLSIFIDKNNQDTLREIVKTYIDVIKVW
jgi:hypothetical protein